MHWKKIWRQWKKYIHIGKYNILKKKKEIVYKQWKKNIVKNNRDSVKNKNNGKKNIGIGKQRYWGKKKKKRYRY